MLLQQYKKLLAKEVSMPLATAMHPVLLLLLY